MTSQQQRHKFIAQLLVAERLTVFVARQQQHRKDVAALFKVRRAAVLGDHAVELFVDRPKDFIEALL